MYFGAGGKVKFVKNFTNKKYTELDITSLFSIIPKVTQIYQANTNANFKVLYNSLCEIKDFRNRMMHGNKGTHSENIMNDISEIVEKIVDQLQHCYNIESKEVVLIKEKFCKTIDDIKDPKQAREKELNSAISNSMIYENSKKWVPMIIESMKSEKLSIIDMEIQTSDIFHVTDFEILSDHNIPVPHDHQDHNIPAIHYQLDHNIPVPHDRQDHNISAPHVNQKFLGPHDHIDYNIPGPNHHKDPNISGPHDHLDYSIPGPHDRQDHNILGPHDCQDHSISRPHDHLDHNIPGPHDRQDHKIPGPHAHRDLYIPGPHDRLDHNIPGPHDCLELNIPEIHDRQDHNILEIYDRKDHKIPYSTPGPEDGQAYTISKPHDRQNRITIACTDILSIENFPIINIIEGDPGSGKSTFLRMMCLEFCKKCSDSTFKTISSYDMMMLINCRDRERIDNFWQYLQQTHYEETIQRFRDKESVISVLKKMNMIIAIDGLDEANDITTALVRDVVHTFAGSKTVRLLITTRRGFSKTVVEQFDQKAIPYCILKIKPITNVIDQENFIKRVITQIPTINSGDIMKTFRAKLDDFKSHFLRPLGLMLFIALFLKFPERTNKLTDELSFMNLLFEMHLNNVSKRMPDGCSDRQYSMAIFKIVGKKCLRLIQMKTFEIDQNNFDSLTAECLEENKRINVEQVLSCVLLKRKCAQTTRSATHDFYHKSQQEYFASRVLTDTLVETRCGTVLNMLQDLTGEDVQEADLERLVLRNRKHGKIIKSEKILLYPS